MVRLSVGCPTFAAKKEAPKRSEPTIGWHVEMAERGWMRNDWLEPCRSLVLPTTAEFGAATSEIARRAGMLHSATSRQAQGLSRLLYLKVEGLCFA